MSIDIQTAIDEINKGKTVFCVGTRTFFRKHAAFDCLELSGTLDFKDYFVRDSFSVHEVLSEWQIVEPKKEIKPCIYCGGPTKLECWPYTVTCQDTNNCWADSPVSESEDEAIRKHNEMYKRLTFLPDDEMKKHLQHLLSFLKRECPYMSFTSHEINAIVWAEKQL